MGSIEVEVPEVVVPETKLYEFLLFHEHFVGTVVDDIFAKDRSGKMLRAKFKLKGNGCRKIGFNRGMIGGNLTV